MTQHFATLPKFYPFANPEKRKFTILMSFIEINLKYSSQSCHIKTRTVNVCFLDWLAKRGHKLMENAAENIGKEWD